MKVLQEDKILEMICATLSDREMVPSVRLNATRTLRVLLRDRKETIWNNKIYDTISRLCEPDKIYLCTGNPHSAQSEILKQIAAILLENVENIESSRVLPALRKLERADVRGAHECLKRLKHAPRTFELCCFDAEHMFPGLHLSKNKTTLSSGELVENSNVRWATSFLGQRSFRTGVHYIEVLISSTNHIAHQTHHGIRYCAHQMFGIAGGMTSRSRRNAFGNFTINSKTHPFVYGNKPVLRSRAWASDLTLWSCDRPLVDRAKYGPALGSLINQGDRVGILIDLRSTPGKLSFTLNGESFGVAFEDVVAPVRPFVSICLEKHNNGAQRCDVVEKCTLINAFSVETEDAIAPIYRMPVSDCARGASQALLFCSNRAPKSFIDKCWNLYKLWRRGKWSVFFTSEKLPIEVDRTMRGGEKLPEDGLIVGGIRNADPPCLAVRKNDGSVVIVPCSKIDEESHRLEDQKEEEKEEKEDKVDDDDDDDDISKDTFVKYMKEQLQQNGGAALSQAVKQACHTNLCSSPYELCAEHLIKACDGDSSVGPAFISLLYLNLLLKNALHRIDFVTSSSLALLTRQKHWILTRLKREFWRGQLESTQTPGRIQESDNSYQLRVLEFNRKRAYGLWAGVKENLILPNLDDQEDTLFGQLEQKIQSISSSELRQSLQQTSVNDTQRRCFLVTFFGESSSSDDVGGQYRELFNELATEIMRSVFNLFVKNGNYMIPNSSSRDQVTLSRFQLVGKIIGMAMRARIQLPLNLSPLVWKFLTHDTFTRDDVMPEEEGGREMEDDEEEEKKNIVRSSDGIRMVELNGTEKEIPIRFRQRESITQLQAIYSGLNMIVPAELVRIFTWQELRDEVCGVADVPIKNLQRIAVYEGFEPTDDVVQYFWRALDAFSPNQRCHFLQFVWAKLRLPTDMEIKKPFRIIRDSEHDKDPDLALPRARTCFFELTLPAYTSQEVMSEKLSFAIKIKGMSDHDVGQHFT